MPSSETQLLSVTSVPQKEVQMRQISAALLLLAITPALSQTPTRPHRRTTTPSPAPAAATPLAPRERALQFLNRLTFGPRPGDVDRLLVQGEEAWLHQQLDPDHIPDPALAKRLTDYPTLTMQPDQALLHFPDRGTLQAIAEGKRPAPTDPQLAAVYEVQLAKYQRDLDEKKTLPNGQPAHPELTLTDDQKAAQKKLDQATAARIAGDLFSLPRDGRMPALLKLPIPDRIAFTGNDAGLPPAQKNLLLSEFTPRERELFHAMSSGPGASYEIVSEISEAKLLRAILSERQLQEVMTDFWFNHFNIYIGKDSDQWYTTSYERDAIRKHALGHFRDLLFATAESPAMMVYLDNWLSIGPDSLANGLNPANPKSKRGSKGLNENYGREVMELHTLSVNGGYTQADVTALSSIFTGWTVDRPNQGGPFLFDPKRHQPGSKQWLGHTIGSVTLPGAPSSHALLAKVGSGGVASSSTEGRPAASPDPGQQEGLQALNVLAQSPKTAHFISYLIAQRFVADAPPAALVDRLAATYLDTDGDVGAILRALVQSAEFNSRLYFRNKVKTPVEFLASAFRSTATDPANPGALVNTLKQMGMPPYYALPPTGYYVTADHWMNSTALVDRLNFAYALTGNKYANQRFDAPRVLALGLMSQPPSASTLLPAAGTASAIYHPVRNTLPASAAATPAGPDIALHVLEDTLIGSDASLQTNQLIHQQTAQLATTSTTPTDALNFLTALILGSPDFQLR